MNKSPIKPDLAGIVKFDYELSEACPIIGSCNLHPHKDESVRDMHYALEFGLCCSGIQRRFFANGFELDIKPGDVWFCGMWEPHGMKVVKTPCEVIVLFIWPPLIAQMRFPEAPNFNPMAFFTAPAPNRPGISGKLRNKMIAYIVRLKEVLSADVPHQTLKLRNIVTEFFLQLYEVWPEAGFWSCPEPQVSFSRINRAVQMVFDSHNFISTQTAARACGMNRHSFGILFKSWMHIEFSDFATKHRLHQAAVQLRGMREPLKAVAQRWGFTDISHFHHAFKKHYGLSPNEYRARFEK